MSKKSVGNILVKGNDFGQTGQSFAGSQNPIEEQINELGRNETDSIFSYRKQLKALRMIEFPSKVRIQEKLIRHFAHQKEKNSRLQEQITVLKGEKTTLQQQILGLQRRIDEVELQVGKEQA